MEESTPFEILQRAKTHKHTYKISSEAFSLDGREFVVSNLSLKKDYSDDYDFLNFRRGLALLEEIIDFNHTEPIVARKGLRKFKDLMPQYLDIKQSHVNTSKHHSFEKHRLLKDLENSQCTNYRIYNTEKANGENAQISLVCDKYWLIGTKNKCLLAMNESDLDNLKNKHEYKQNILVAKTWFSLLKGKSEEEIKGIQNQLSDKTLIGEYCNMENMQHLVNYGKEAHLFFYALVQKLNRVQDCLPLSTTMKFLDKFGLPTVKVEIVETKTVDHTIQKLREIVVKINEMTMKEGGEGSVVYVSGVTNEDEKNLLVCKVKTIEYRIYRKLREKLKIYLTKYNKNFQNLMKKFTKEIGEISREFNLNRPLNQYIQTAKKAFILCQEQSRPISRFISNRFIDFLKLLDKNVTKEKFMEIVNSNNHDMEEDEEQNGKQELHEAESEPKKEEQGEQERIKQLIVLIPLTIPSTGKSSLLEIMKTMDPHFKIWSIASDEIRRGLIDEMMKKMKNITQKQAFEKTAKKANDIFYSKMGETLRNISMSKERNHVFFIDKNHPESAVKPCIKNLQEKVAPFKNIKMVKLCLLPTCKQRLQEKGLYRYPFSSAYVLSCLKRVSGRHEHLTLEGSEEERCNIVFGFANLFRNFSLSPYNLKKYFDGQIDFVLNNQSCLDPEKNKDIYDLFKQILLKGKPGKFDEVHPKLQLFVSMLKTVQIEESQREISAKQALLRLQDSFDHFQDIGFEQEKKEQKNE